RRARLPAPGRDESRPYRLAHQARLLTLHKDQSGAETAVSPEQPGHSRPPPLGKRDPPRRYQPSRRRPQRKSAVRGATAAASPTWAGVIGSKPTAPTNTSPKNTSRTRARLRRKLTSGKRGDRS